MMERRLIFSAFPYEIMIRYIAISDAYFLIQIAGDLVKKRLRIPTHYLNDKKIMDYLKGYRLMHHYLKVESGIVQPVYISGVLYINWDDKEALKSFLLEDFWDYCLNIGDFNKKFTEADILPGLLKFNKPLIIKNFWVSDYNPLDKFFYFPCFLDLERKTIALEGREEVVKCLFTIKDMETLRKEEKTDRVIYIPTEIEPREGGEGEIPEKPEIPKEGEGIF